MIAGNRGQTSTEMMTQMCALRLPSVSRFSLTAVEPTQSAHDHIKELQTLPKLILINIIRFCLIMMAVE